MAAIFTRGKKNIYTCTLIVLIVLLTVSGTYFHLENKRNIVVLEESYGDYIGTLKNIITQLAEKSETIVALWDELDQEEKIQLTKELYMLRPSTSINAGKAQLVYKDFSRAMYLFLSDIYTSTNTQGLTGY